MPTDTLPRNAPPGHATRADTTGLDTGPADTTPDGERGHAPGTSVTTGLRVEHLEALLVELPFRFRFGHALAARTSSVNLIVCVRLRDGSVGYGEGAPREYVTGETPDGALERVVDAYAPSLIGHALPADDVPGGLRRLRDALHADRPAPGAAWCAVETALLDALGHALGRSAADLLGGTRRRTVRYGGVLPFASGPALPALLLAFRLYGFQDVKLKVGRGAAHDLTTVRLARRLLGRAVELRADANCAWSVDQTTAMSRKLRPYRVRSFEQPLAADDLAGLAHLTATLPDDIVLDESLCSVADARRLIAARAGSVFNIRVSKCGGPLAALEIVALAHRAGLPCQLGAQVGESGILTAAGRLVATIARPAFRHHEGADNRFLLRHDLTAEDLTVRVGGRADALTGPGLGVRVRRDVLRSLARRRAAIGTPGPGSTPWTPGAPRPPRADASTPVGG